jgi:hypothetical protein
MRALEHVKLGGSSRVECSCAGCRMDVVWWGCFVGIGADGSGLFRQGKMGIMLVWVLLVYGPLRLLLFPYREVDGFWVVRGGSAVHQTDDSVSLVEISHGSRCKYARLRGTRRGNHGSNSLYDSCLESSYHNTNLILLETLPSFGAVSVLEI